VPKTTPTAIIAAAIILAAAVMFVSRYQVSGVGTVVYRLDRWTGNVDVCVAAIDSRLITTGSVRCP